MESVSGSAVVIDNLGYNRDIEAKGETSFGFTCTYGDSEKGTCPTDTQLMCVNGRVEDSAEQSEWNRKMIGAESEEVQAARTPVDGRVKVAMLDSGINYSEKVNVVERANFLPDADPETENDLMDDPTGHGTAAASFPGCRSISGRPVR